MLFSMQSVNGLDFQLDMLLRLGVSLKEIADTIDMDESIIDARVKAYRQLTQENALAVSRVDTSQWSDILYRASVAGELTYKESQALSDTFKTPNLTEVSNRYGMVLSELLYLLKRFQSTSFCTPEMAVFLKWVEEFGGVPESEIPYMTLILPLFNEKVEEKRV